MTQNLGQTLDAGTYLYSIRTMYRILTDHAEVRERRNQLRHPSYTRPELLATELCLDLVYGIGEEKAYPAS